MKASYVVKQFVGTFIFFAIIFFCAGKVMYWQGLTYLVICLIMVILNLTVLSIDAELLKERSKPGENTKSWDKAILGFSLIATIAMYAVAGLDSGRYHWSPDFNIGLTVTGIIFTATGQLLFLIAQKQNKFFSSTVRIQTDRDHTVCDTGLYKVVRHPAYMGSVIQAIGFPLLMGSLWSIIPVALLILLHIIRTSLEDKVLIQELKGYHEYSTKTRYRIIPYIW
jgi:protein-S-isoprenylcysteine O-methyltransferase Ste14